MMHPRWRVAVLAAFVGIVVQSTACGSTKWQCIATPVGVNQIPFDGDTVTADNEDGAVSVCEADKDILAVAKANNIASFTCTCSISSPTGPSGRK